MKQTIKRLAGFAGYEISRKPARSAEPGKAALVDAVLKKCDVPILEPRAYAEYRKACAPLFPEPARVPAEFPLAHYQNVAKAVQNESMSLTLFAFAAGEGISTHSAPGDALVYILDGQAEVTIGGQKQTVVSGQSIVMPANIPHGLEAREPFKMLLIVVFK